MLGGKVLKLEGSSENDAGYHVFSKNSFLKAVTLGCFFIIWLAKRTLQILHGCFDVRACIAGWNNGNMCALPKFRLWLSPDVKVGAKNSLEVFSMYGSCSSSSQQVHHSNWYTPVLIFTSHICVSLLLFFKVWGTSLCYRIDAMFSYSFLDSNAWLRAEITYSHSLCWFLEVIMENMKYAQCFLDNGQVVVFQMKYKNKFQNLILTGCRNLELLLGSTLAGLGCSVL